MTVATEADTTGDELVLEPPSPVASVTTRQAAATIKVDDATATRINAAVTAYIESLTTLEAQSPEFERKVASISRMGRDEIRRSAEASSRFLDRPTAALKQGPARCDMRFQPVDLFADISLGGEERRLHMQPARIQIGGRVHQQLDLLGDALTDRRGLARRIRLRAQRQCLDGVDVAG